MTLETEARQVKKTRIKQIKRGGKLCHAFEKEQKHAMNQKSSKQKNGLTREDFLRK